MPMQHVVADGYDVGVGSAKCSGCVHEKYNEEDLLRLWGPRATSLFEEDFIYRWKQSSLLKSYLFEERPPRAAAPIGRCGTTVPSDISRIEIGWSWILDMP
ncbi:hypothetical protein ON010_g10596 [Phytophthora cinnamomi]|nr:hypothetical protein ON010_g10596 [Phytophthora cinnamomi]